MDSMWLCCGQIFVSYTTFHSFPAYPTSLGVATPAPDGTLSWWSLEVDSNATLDKALVVLSSGDILLTQGPQDPCRDSLM